MIKQRVYLHTIEMFLSLNMHASMQLSFYKLESLHFICENKTTLINLWYINLAAYLQTDDGNYYSPNFGTKLSPQKTFWLASYMVS